MSLAVVDEHQPGPVAGWHLFGQPVLEEELIARFVGAGLLGPGLRFHIRDRFAFSRDVLAVPLDVHASADHARMRAVLPQNQIDQHGHVAARRLDLYPDLNSVLIESCESRFEQIRVVEDYVRPCRPRRGIREVCPAVAPAPAPQHFDDDSHLFPGRTRKAGRH